MNTGTADWASIAPFLVGLTGFIALFQGIAKMIKPVTKADRSESFSKWIDAFASMGGGAITLGVFGAWAAQLGLSLTTLQWVLLVFLLVLWWALWCFLEPWNTGA